MIGAPDIEFKRIRKEFRESLVVTYTPERVGRPGHAATVAGGGPTRSRWRGTPAAWMDSSAAGVRRSQIMPVLR
ncbi:hypothetical protein GCM10010421_64230 [Streptomyces glaucus]|uniref:Uncharacterized protein n=1 Tax=Streptomyces glaucus TaxID=284029 RepID=A0ABP5XNK6_9ACTN